MNDVQGQAAYPRLAAETAETTVKDIADVSLAELVAMSSTDLSGMSFYPMAVTRVTEHDIREIQTTIRMIAAQNGYPELPTKAQKTAFDRALVAEILDIMPMTPADAADEGVWSFIALRACPDVTAWRYPPGALDDDGKRKITPERYIGRPRNIFRRLWWRAYTLTPTVSTQLIEDETVQIMERPSIGGYLPLARLVAGRQLSAVAAGDGQRQELLREVTKRLRRRMGYVSVYALGDRRLAQLVDDVFDEAYLTLHGRERQRPTEPHVDRNEAAPESPGATTDRASGVPDVGESLVPDPVGSDRVAHIDGAKGIYDTGAGTDTVATFEARCGRYWNSVSQMVVQPTWDEFRRLRTVVQEYRSENLATSTQAERIAADLEVLFDVSDEFTPDERSVVYAAATYFVRFDDENPDYYVDGLEDDDHVVDAAYAALDRPRE